MSDLTYLDAIQVLDDLIQESAKRANRVAECAGQNWSTTFGIGYAIRLEALQEAKAKLVKIGIDKVG